jgi:hypothetical protein
VCESKEEEGGVKLIKRGELLKIVNGYVIEMTMYWGT